MKTLKSKTTRFSVVIAALSFAALPLLMSGCNTTEGVGKDIEAAGDAISDTARDAND